VTGNTSNRLKPTLSAPGWANRVLLLSLAGILFLTLFPFRFAAHAPLPLGRLPVMLGGRGKVNGPLDVFLNILLFIPFGFGLSEKLHDRKWAWKKTFFTVWIAGTLLSYVVEFLQLYIPSRDSGWQDILTNGTGAALGSVIFLLLGMWLVDHVANVDFALRLSLTMGRLALILGVYFGLWFTLSAKLQRATMLSNWDRESHIFIGGVSTNRTFSPWRGTVSRLDLWDSPVPDDVARSLTAGQMPDRARDGLVASYNFLSSTPRTDQMGFLPQFTWIPSSHSVAPSQSVEIDGGSWLVSGAPATSLVDAVQKTSQFSLRIVCTSLDIPFFNERIVSVVQPSGTVDLRLEQTGTHLGFWFRNPLLARHPLLAWSTPDIFVADQPRDILFSYDGSNLSLFVDGVKIPDVYRLGPGTRFAALMRTPRTAELDVYNYIYETLIFFPAGVLIGLAAFRKSSRNVARYLLIVVGFLLPPYLYERILSGVSGRAESLESMFLCFILIVAGSLWINADRLPS
jgi:VanZ family protein